MDINQALYLGHEVCVNRLTGLENLAGEVVNHKIPFTLEENMLTKDEISLNVVMAFTKKYPLESRQTNFLQCLINEALEFQHEITKQACAKEIFSLTEDINLYMVVINTGDK